MTDRPSALVSVPVELMARIAALLENPKAEHPHDVSYLIEEVTALAAAPAAPQAAGVASREEIAQMICGFKLRQGKRTDTDKAWKDALETADRILALRAQPQAREDAGPAEPEVGRVIYKRIEKLLTDDPQGWERAYLSHLVASVEEVGGYDGPQAREDAQPVAWAIFWRHAMTLHPTLEAAETARKGVPHDIVPLYTHPAPDALRVLDTERMLSCLNDLRPSDNKNSRSTTAYNYLLSVIRLAALQQEGRDRG